MRIVVCVKQVPDTATRIKIAPSGDAIVEGDVSWIVSPFDEFAIEEALRLREAKGGDVVLVTVGPDRAQTALRNGLAMGADSAIHVKDAVLDAADPAATAMALAAAIRTASPVDLILAGQQGVGGDHSQVPGLLAEALDLPQVTVAVKIEVGDGRATVEREVEGGTGGLGDLAPGRRIGPERAERAPVREPQGNHGREEEDHPDARCGGAGPRAGFPGPQDPNGGPRAASGTTAGEAHRRRARRSCGRARASSSRRGEGDLR